jgi:integrase
MNEDMLSWSSSSQIVYLLLTFIDSLLENGGRRVKSLAFSSIEKYFSLVAEVLIREAWSIDFESCDANTLSNLFDCAAQQIDQDQGRTALKYFAVHLQDSMGTPYFGARWSDPRSPIRIRTSLVLPQHIDRALALLAKQADPLSRQASTLIATCSSYGLRRLEAFGLAAHQFDVYQNHHLSVTRTIVADLKTKWSRRVIASPLLAGPMVERLTQEIQLARTSPREVQYLFEADTRDFRINSVSKISALATTALRVATDNPAIVPHHLRHSFGTILGIAVLAAPGSPGPLTRLATRLLGSGYASGASSVLDHPKDWPFGIDALANVLGHADVGMFLNTYFHASHWVISDRCAQWQPRCLQQARLANILNVDRTTLSKLKTRLKTRHSKSDISFDEVVNEISRRHEDTATHQQVDHFQSHAQYSDHWSHVFRALLYRIDNELNLDEMWSYARAHLGFSPEKIQAISRRYAHFVRETGFDDFEPASSELIDAVASHRSGVSRGRLERESFTSSVQQWVNAASENRCALEELLRIWVARVDPTSPRIVCQNMDELRMTIMTLENLGATATHLGFELHGDPLDPWLIKAQEFRPIVSQASSRASRGSARVKIPEVSIAVKQVLGSPIPDGRDFHRALVSMYLAIAD